MANISFKAGNIYCYDCVLALKKFIGSLDGIQSIEMTEEDRFDISFDPSSIEEGKLRQIVKDSTEKLGFKIMEV
jgi:copper chaperone CopZ